MKTHKDRSPALTPFDDHNKRLEANVHPPEWINPTPSGRYNLVIIGAGTAGLVAAAGAAGLGGKVALIERDLLGGDCLNVGCVPSKALIRSARAFADVRDASRFGVTIDGEVAVDFGAVMKRMRSLRADISPHDSAKRFRDLGVDVFLGEGRFTGRNTVNVAGTTLKFSRALIATGARAALPPVPGLAETGYLTNETVFSLTELPKRLAIIGAGPIGCELAQSFARFGSNVTLIEAAPRIMNREHEEASKLVEKSLEHDGVRVLCDSTVTRVDGEDTNKVLTLKGNRGASSVEADAILVSIGRTPNVSGLDLEVAGIEFDRRTGVNVDDNLRTTNRNVFAAGDVCSRFQFTHTADAMARIVLRNALFFGRAKMSALTVPWATFTDPEVAHVGLSSADAASRGFKTVTYRVDLSGIDRAILDGETDGFLEIYTRHDKDKIVGATLVSRHASEMISEMTLAIEAGVGLGTVANTIHPYPIQADVFKRAGDAYARTRLTPRTAKVLRWILARRR